MLCLWLLSAGFLLPPVFLAVLRVCSGIVFLLLLCSWRCNCAVLGDCSAAPHIFGWWGGVSCAADLVQLSWVTLVPVATPGAAPAILTSRFSKCAVSVGSWSGDFRQQHREGYLLLATASCVDRRRLIWMAMRNLGSIFLLHLVH